MTACSVAGCAGEAKRRGMCFKHYQRVKKHGDPFAVPDMRPSGAGNLRKRDGYIVHNKDGKNTLEHVLVAERALGKPLPTGAQVHHWDKNGSNNAGANLVVCLISITTGCCTVGWTLSKPVGIPTGCRAGSARPTTTRRACT